MDGRKKPLIFEKYPDLEASVPWLKLAPLRTPVKRLITLEEKLKASSLWMKRDDLTSPIYGGNKVRKLEFILADAKEKNCDKVMTVGGIGSNHCVATGFFCKELGLNGVVALLDQPLNQHVRNNLLLELYVKNEIIYARTQRELKLKIFWKLMKTKHIYFMGPGGSTPLGTIGFINAALELKNQIDNGGLPQPDHLFVACGSAGTVAGLTIGMQLAGLKTQVHGVIISNRSSNYPNLVRKLVENTRNLMIKNGVDLPKLSLDHLILEKDYVGKGYGIPTLEALQAIQLVEESEQIKLESTYTGKTFAGLIAFLREKKDDLRRKTILFWNTFNSRDFSEILEKLDYHDLPKKLHWVFEKELND